MAEVANLIDHRDDDAGMMDKFHSTEDEVEAYSLCVAYLSIMSSFHEEVSLTNTACFLTKPPRPYAS
jgi:hypothetical protein